MRRQWTADEVAEHSELLSDLVDGAVYRDVRTGWVGALRLPEHARNLQHSPKEPGRAMIDLEGASGKEGQTTELRTVFLDDLLPVDGGPVGFGD